MPADSVRCTFLLSKRYARLSECSIADCMEYISPLIALIATILGISGDTKNKDANGWRRITRVGYVSLLIAASACVLSIWQIRSARIEHEARKNEAAQLLSVTTEGIANPFRRKASAGSSPAPGTKAILALHAGNTLLL